ncbi:MAG: DUF1850 domain-containing protein [Proteobacteria bacterium]|nr:DUF1850 domain-containing protein [Pseudomonadota bacterium]
MNAVCILLAGSLRATLPAQEFTVAWMHSVEKTRWEERYHVEGHSLVLDRARVEGSGAGMDPAAGAKLEGGWWTWRPRGAPLPELKLTISPYTSDYDICFAGRCTALHVLAQTSRAPALAVIRPCDGARRAQSAGGEQVRR